MAAGAGLRQGIDCRSVDRDAAAVQRACAVIIECGLPGDIDRPAVDGEGSVGVESVCITLAHIDRDHTVVDLDKGAELRGLARRVDAVVGGIDGYTAAVDLHARAFDSFCSGDREGTAVDDGIGRSLDAVIACRDRKCAARDVDVSDGIIIVILAVESILTCVDRETAVADPDGIVRFNGILCCCDRIGPAGELQVVLAADAVSGRRDRKTPRSVQHEIGFGKDHGIQVCRAVGIESAGRAERVVACGGDEDFVRGLHIDSRRVLVGDRDVVEDELYFGRICCLYDDGGVARVSCDQVDAFFTDRDILSVCQGDLHRAACIGSLDQVPV